VFYFPFNLESDSKLNGERTFLSEHSLILIDKVQYAIEKNNFPVGDLRRYNAPV
jgi:hypothetical protein